MGPKTPWASGLAWVCAAALVMAACGSDTGGYTGLYFQTGGTLAVHTGTPPGSATFSATLTNLSLAEVTIDTTTFASALVLGGGCYTLSGSATVAATPASCAPFCGAHTPLVTPHAVV